MELLKAEISHHQQRVSILFILNNPFPMFWVCRAYCLVASSYYYILISYTYQIPNTRR